MHPEMLSQVYIIVRVEAVGVYAIYAGFLTSTGDLVGLHLIDVRSIEEIETNGD